MTTPGDSIPWWLIPLPAVVCSGLLILVISIGIRKRRWWDLRVLNKAVRLPSEHIAKEPKEVRDLRVGESGWVSRFAIATSAKGDRVFLRWTATVESTPENPDSDFAPLRIVRFERGFSLQLRPGVQFRTSTLPWADYAPVIEVARQTGSSDAGIEPEPPLRER